MIQDKKAVPMTADLPSLAARVAALEKALSVSDGKLTLSLDGASIELSKFGITIRCGDFTVKALRNISIRGGGNSADFECPGAVTIRGSTVNLD